MKKFAYLLLLIVIITGCTKSPEMIDDYTQVTEITGPSHAPVNTPVIFTVHPSGGNNLLFEWTIPWGYDIDHPSKYHTRENTVTHTFRETGTWHIKVEYRKSEGSPLEQGLKTIIIYN
jgi:hypothetical protein